MTLLGMSSLNSGHAENNSSCIKKVKTLMVAHDVEKNTTAKDESHHTNNITKIENITNNNNHNDTNKNNDLFLNFVIVTLLEWYLLDLHLGHRFGHQELGL